MTNPTDSYLRHNPDRIMYTPAPLQSPTHSPRPVLAVVNKSPTHSSSRTRSVRSWLSNASQQASMSSASSNNHTRLPQSPARSSGYRMGSAISPASPREEIEQQQYQPFIPHAQTLGTVAELEGTMISRSPAELPGDTQPHPPSIYRSYGQPASVGNFEDTRSVQFP
ncbi:hypothetical protein VP1G_01329 [Cytospora mali]|uniref:Uncharacterized protein n=1 Tax=Cytospora mali TaxID=578113 RepID=A0A194UQU2_CYTMA|nr:hypothetical protein VP1G_01329 [Valsa mali var. pyri (nom. inval.)]